MFVEGRKEDSDGWMDVCDAMRCAMRCGADVSSTHGLGLKKRRG